MTDPTLKRENNFNLLRMIFAVLVILSHSSELVDGNRSREILSQVFHTVSFGELAVDGFFLLSGYLIIQSWVNNPNVVGFIRSRILRIYPAFIMATAVCILIVGPLAAVPSVYFSHLWITGIIKSTLLLLEPLVPPVFKGTHYDAINGSMWTISLEFKCYLGVLAAGVIGLATRRGLWLFITALVLAAFTLYRFGILVDAYGVKFLSHPLFRLSSFFLSGGAFYLFRNKLVFNGRNASLAAVALIVFMFSLPLSEVALATAGGYLLFYGALKPMPIIANFNRLPDVSYGVYLYGWPVQKLILWYFPLMSPWVLFVFSCSAAVFCGIVSWYTIEKQFLKLKHGYPGRAREKANPLGADAG